MMPLLRLSVEQADALQAIKAGRDTARLAGSLAIAFPTAAGRSGDRQARLIAEGVRRGAAHGLDHLACLGRYLACGIVLGTDFEHRPEHPWARELLAATDRPQGSRMFQLCRRTREELVRPAAATDAAGADAITPEVFDRALAALDAALLPCGTLGTLLPIAPPALARACDIDTIELRLEDHPAGQPPQRYHLDDGARWHRVPNTRPRAALTITAGARPAAVPGLSASALPTRLNIVSQTAERGQARLRVRTRASHCCDPQVHPRITFETAQGPASWRGAHAAEVSIDLQALPDAAAVDSDGPQPVIGRETAPRWSVLRLSGCGLRDAGPALGEQRARVAVYPGEQHWAAWHREPGAPLTWPVAEVPPLTAPALRCRVERDGLPLAASRWEAGLRDLDRQLRDGLARLTAAWARTSGVSDGRLHCEPTVMSGATALTWGWTEGGDALTDPPCHRLAGSLDLVVCRLGLRLAGTLALRGAAGRLALHCADHTALKLQFDRRPADDLPTLLRAARVAFRHPFALSFEAMTPLSDVAVIEPDGAVTGALVGAGGLRARADGAGWQWFCELAIEPVAVALRLNDPLLGVQTLRRPLLPALALLDWSLG